jgi:diguanylate cyclase (GGDEF)-like protein
VCGSEDQPVARSYSLISRLNRPVLAWVPVYAIVVATGGLHSIFAPLSLAWLALVAARVPARYASTYGSVALLMLAVSDFLLGRLDTPAAYRAAGLVLAGVSVMLVVRALSARAAQDERAVVHLPQNVNERPRDDASPESGADEVTRTLMLVARSVQAQRAVLWEVDPAGGIAHALATTAGRKPDDVRLYGDPLRWVWSEGVPLRVTEAVPWAPGAAIACGVAVRARTVGAALLTLEYADAQAVPADDALEEAAAYLRAFVLLLEQQESARAMQVRYEGVLDLLARVPRSLEQERFATELTESARSLTGASGAALAVAVADGGVILAVAGDDGGPDIDARFGPADSELGLAATAGAPIVRTDRRAQNPRPSVAAPGEGWRVEPRSVIALPLRTFDQHLVGMLAVWSPEKAHFGDDVVALLVAIAPYAAQQLQHANRYGALKEDAARDALTGIYNRGAFDAHLERECVRYERLRRPFSIVLLDLDHFKKINDTYGHEGGDEVLRALGQALRSSLRTSDFAARYGGEEFVILLPETELRAAAELGERLRVRIEALEVRSAAGVIPVRASVGVASCPASAARPEDLLQVADAAMYRAKDNGRNRVEQAP